MISIRGAGGIFSKKENKKKESIFLFPRKKKKVMKLPFIEKRKKNRHRPKMLGEGRRRGTIHLHRALNWRRNRKGGEREKGTNLKAEKLACPD